MQFTLSNNPIDKLSCFLSNKREELSGVLWRKGKQKEAECRICRRVLDSKKDYYSPIQCGWHKVNKYNWICHRCFDHRNFQPYIEMIDEAEKKEWEERSKMISQVRLKSQEIINLLKEYLPEYNETLDLYDLYVDLYYYNADGNFTETEFSFSIEDKNEEYVLEINNSCILKVSIKTKEVVEVANYLDEEIAKHRTYENPWTWDDAIEVIKKRLEKR